MDEKGHIRIFTDTKVKVDGTALVVSTLSKTGTDTRDWHLAAEEGTVAAEYAGVDTMMSPGSAHVCCTTSLWGSLRTQSTSYAPK